VVAHAGVRRVLVGLPGATGVLSTVYNHCRIKTPSVAAWQDTVRSPGAAAALPCFSGVRRPLRRGRVSVGIRAAWQQSRPLPARSAPQWRRARRLRRLPAAHCASAAAAAVPASRWQPDRAKSRCRYGSAAADRWRQMSPRVSDRFATRRPAIETSHCSFERIAEAVGFGDLAATCAASLFAALACRPRPCGGRPVGLATDTLLEPSREQQAGRATPRLARSSPRRDGAKRQMCTSDGGRRPRLLL